MNTLKIPFIKKEVPLKKNLLFTGIACLFMVMLGCSKGESDAKKSAELTKAHVHSAGETFELCLHCGEIKGSDKCCNHEGRVKCPKCGLLKGSVGCCKIPPGLEKAEICTHCGEIKGTEKCCKLEGREKCPKCGLLKGSPGCCKL
jgi:hypothetical protein